MTTLSNDIFQLAGQFDRYRRTGGTITAEDAVRIAGALMMIGEGVCSLEASQKAIADELDGLIEEMSHEPRHVIARPPLVRTVSRAFEVIEGSMA